MPTKAVRFSEKEDAEIKKFLSENQFLDFSTLARLAISNFIQEPEIKLKPVSHTEEETGSQEVH